MYSIYVKKASLTFGLLLCLLLSVNAQDDRPQDYLPKEFHSARRDALRAIMPENSVVAVFASPTRTFSNDVEYLYHQNPDLYYFSGYNEPHSLLLIFKSPQTDASGNAYSEVLFVQKRNAAREQWTGKRLGDMGAKSKLGINEVFNGEEFNHFNIDFAKFDKIIFDRLPVDVPVNRNDSADLSHLLQQFRDKAAIPADYSKIEKFDNKLYRELTGRLREIKTPEELDLIRKAVEISCLAHNEAMKAIRPDMSELEVQGLHEYVQKKYGAEEVGYGSIVGAGDDGCILHYEENNRTRIGNSMLLMDVGAEYHGYSADVTRTVPAGGKFSAEEKIIYQLVYDAQEAAFKILKEGAKISDAGAAAKEVIAEGLLKLGIIKDKKEVNKYYPHSLSHHIGLDVHDRNFSPTLKKGMVITIEPGIYIPSGSDCDKKWWTIGVRIEDDALIRENDYELLSSYSPRKVEDVEKIMSQKSGVGNYKLPPLQSAKSKKAF